MVYKPFDLELLDLSELNLRSNLIGSWAPCFNGLPGIVFVGKMREVDTPLISKPPSIQRTTITV